MKVILIGGKARSGKDTLADILTEELIKKNKKVCKIQVGQYIKYYAQKYFGWDGKEETKPRDLLNELGTEIIRKKIDENFHIDRLIQDIKVLSYYYDVFIVSDIRFPIEIDKPKNEFKNVFSIKVIRENKELNDLQKKHLTETSLDNYNRFDYKIENSGTIEDLKIKAKKTLQEIGD